MVGRSAVGNARAGARSCYGRGTLHHIAVVQGNAHGHRAGSPATGGGSLISVKYLPPGQAGGSEPMA